MVQKRSLDDEEIFVSFKHPREVDIYSVLLDHPPRKSASIGPEHQADVPLWGAQGTHNSSDLENEKRLMGTCVIPMPDSDLFTDMDCKVGKGRYCSCEDGESVRCVRQHILEAREIFLKTIGPKRFEELGFDDMGEQVAKTWSEEEEQLFRQVVFSTPASLGKNLWDKLSTVFPSRTKKEIVSIQVDLQIKGWQKLGLVLHVLCRDGWKSVFRCSYSRGQPESFSSETILLESSFRRVFLVYI